MNACKRAMVDSRTPGPAPGPGDHRADRPHAAGHRDRRRPHRPRSACDPTSSGSTAPPARPRWARPSATWPSTAACRWPSNRTPACPSVVDGAMHYDLTPDQLADHLERFVTELGVSVIGGCCGTTPEHLRAVVERCRGPRPREPATPSTSRRPPRSTAPSPSTRTPPSWSSASAPTPTGRRSSATPCWRPTGTPPWPMARDQIKEGAHVLDVCVDYTGADGVADMNEVVSRFATQASVPAHGRLDRGPGGGGRPHVDRRPGHPQLGQPRGGRRARHPARHAS